MGADGHFRVTLSLRREPTAGPVYCKMETSARFRQLKTVKLSCEATYRLDISFKPPQILEWVQQISRLNDTLIFLFLRTIISLPIIFIRLYVTVSSLSDFVTCFIVWTFYSMIIFFIVIIVIVISRDTNIHEKIHSFFKDNWLLHFVFDNFELSIWISFLFDLDIYFAIYINLQSDKLYKWDLVLDIWPLFLFISFIFQQIFMLFIYA